MTLVNELKTNNNARRLFGKREIVIIEKQLLGVNLRPSEKTRLSRDIRKKFAAIRSLAPYSQEFELKHGSLIREMIKEAREILVSGKYFPRIKRIVLFGSAAEHRLLLNSDIDIAVEFGESITKQEAVRFRLDASRTMSEKIDLRVYDVLPDKIKKEIDQKGKVLYESKDK